MLFRFRRGAREAQHDLPGRGVQVERNNKTKSVTENPPNRSKAERKGHERLRFFFRLFRSFFVLVDKNKKCYRISCFSGHTRAVAGSIIQAK